MFQVLKQWPNFSRRPEDILGILPATPQGIKPFFSLDAEWTIRTNRPTIIGVSNGVTGVSCFWEEGKPYLTALLRKYPNIDFLTYNGISSDAPVLAEEGIIIPLERHQDGILWHWLGNMSLSKGSKTADDEGERRGRGWNNLYAACSCCLAVPRWKSCVGEEQCLAEERPCPEHDARGYNYNDCHWPALAFPLQVQRAKLLGVDRLYPLHRELVHVLSKNRAKGVFIDVPYVDTLRDQFKVDCDNIAKQLPFNPNSPKQVMSYFREQGIFLPNAQQSTIEGAAEEHDNSMLDLLETYGQLGNGPDRWFAPLKFDYEKNNWGGYVDGSGFIHCNLAPFTSTGRLACSNPNLQNISHRPKKHELGPDGKPLNPGFTIQDRIRRALRAPEGMYLAEADYSNAENRVMLHLAGHAVPEGVDLHPWVAAIAEFKPEDPFSRKEGSPRQAAKTVQHGNFYGEGLQFITLAQYRSTKVQNEIARGLRIAYPEWTFEGMIATFTGINFARRAFGDASYENRIKANAIIGKLFGRFPGVRKLQQRISQMVERERCVRNEFGYVLASYGYGPERVKTALAFTGSNPVAHATKLAIINADRHPMLDCRLQIHDSLLFFVDKRHTPEQAKVWIKEAMEVRLEEMGGLTIPVDVKVGETWADLKKI